MNQLPIIQTFFNKPVRFFKASFEVEMHRHHDGASGQKSTEMRHLDILPALKDGDSRIVAEHHATARAGSCFLEEP